MTMHEALNCAIWCNALMSFPSSGVKVAGAIISNEYETLPSAM